MDLRLAMGGGRHPPCFVTPMPARRTSPFTPTVGGGDGRCHRIHRHQGQIPRRPNGLVVRPRRLIRRSRIQLDVDGVDHRSDVHEGLYELAPEGMRAVSAEGARFENCMLEECSLAENNHWRDASLTEVNDDCIFNGANYDCIFDQTDFLSRI